MKEENEIVVDSIAVLAEGRMVGTESNSGDPMSASLPNGYETTNGKHGEREVSSIVDLTRTRKMDDIERQAILYTLRMTQGNVVEAARILGLGPATVYRKIKRYGVRAKSIAATN
jgi:transcriptional regulator of acetoin/glycerol metabolism